MFKNVEGGDSVNIPVVLSPYMRIRRRATFPVCDHDHSKNCAKVYHDGMFRSRWWCPRCAPVEGGNLNKKNITLTIGLLATSLLLAPAPVGPETANADFHGVCTGMVTAYANVDLSASLDGEQFTYEGIVNCPDTKVTINKISLFGLDPYTGEAIELDNSTGAECSATLTEPCTLSTESAAPGPGTYEVLMFFDVDDPDSSEVDFKNVERYGRFSWDGIGKPLTECSSLGFFPVYLPDGCRG